MVFCRVVQEGLSEEVTFEQSPKGSRGVGQVCIWGKRGPGRGNSKCKGP